MSTRALIAPTRAESFPRLVGDLDELVDRGLVAHVDVRHHIKRVEVLQRWVALSVICGHAAAVPLRHPVPVRDAGPGPPSRAVADDLGVAATALERGDLRR